ncbi:MAG: hypothetical protein GY716_19790 [bacterium]|nr:hypothetical protein [bacterium]
MSVATEYRKRIDAMSMAEKVRRAEVLFLWARDYLTREIVDRHGPMSDRRLKLELARRLYGAEPAMKRLIDELQARASR